MRRIRIAITSICLIMLLSVTTAFGAIASAPDIQPWQPITWQLQHQFHYLEAR